MFNTIPDLLRTRAAVQSEDVAYIFLGANGSEESRVSYRQLDHDACRIATNLGEVCQPGDRVLLVYPQGIDYIAGFLGCLCHGSIAVPTYSSTYDRRRLRLDHILLDARPRVALTVASWKPMIERQLEERGLAGLVTCIATDEIRAERNSFLNGDLSGSSLAMLQYTSGSTSLPRGVMVTHDNLLTNLRLIKESFHQDSESVIVSWLPAYHDMGLIGGLLQPLYLGARCVLISPMTFLKNPALWLKTISDYRATTSGGPDFAYQLCNRTIDVSQCPALDLSQWTVAFNGAEHVRLSTLREFSQKFASCGFKFSSFFPCYGLAEATLLVSAKQTTAPVVLHLDRVAAGKNHVRAVAADTESIAVVGCGLPQEGCVEIVDPESGCSVGPDTVGEIWISGRSVASGYWDKAEESDNVFHATLPQHPRKQFLRSGDLGFVYDNNLFITGRCKDMIIVRGRNHYPEDIEETIHSLHPELGASAVFSLDLDGVESAVLVQEVDRNPSIRSPEALLTAVRSEIASRHDLLLRVALLTTRGTIPRTTSGKLQRSLCCQLFATGQVPALLTKEWPNAGAVFIQEPVEMPDPANVDRPIDHEIVLDNLQRQLRRLLNLNEDIFDAGATLPAFGLDSLGISSLARYIRGEYGVSLDFADLFENNTLSDIADIIIRGRTSRYELTTMPPQPQVTSCHEALSDDQERLWLATRGKMPAEAFNLQSSYRIEGPLDVPRLFHCIDQVVQHHDSLRSVFRSVNGVPQRLVRNSPKWESREVEMPFREDEDQVLSTFLSEEQDKPFDLEKGPLLRVAVANVAESTHILVLTIHHIACDASSLGVFCRELSRLYSTQGAPTFWAQEHSGDSDPLLPPPSPEDEKRITEFWRHDLMDAPSLALPLDYQRATQYAFRTDLRFTIHEDRVQALRALARAHDTTLFVALLSAFQVVLSNWCEQDELLIGIPIEGRNHASVENAIGFFAHPILLRSSIVRGKQFRTHLTEVHHKLVACIRHQGLPFAKMVEFLHRSSNNPLIPSLQVVFNLIPHTAINLELGQLTVFPVGVRVGGVDSDLFLTVVESKTTLDASLLYDPSLFDPATAVDVVESFQGVLRQIVNSPGLPLEKIQLSRALLDRARRRSPTICIAGTFQLHDLSLPITKWLREVEVEARVDFAPQEQLFQELLNPESLLRQNSGGLNVLLVRRSDLPESMTGGEDSWDYSDKFIHVLKTLNDTARPYLVCICSDPGDTPASAQEWYIKLESEFPTAEGIHILSGHKVAESFGIERVFDAHSGDLANIPYSQPYFVALAAAIVRKYCNLMRVFPTKVIVVDCDNTLWKGICGEDGPSGILVSPHHILLQNFLLACYRAGMLLCLCSKNHADDIDAVFKENTAMVLQKEHFAAQRVNWKHKSENVRELSKEIGLGIDTFVFLDDDPKECAELRSLLPEMITIQVPSSEAYPSFLQHLWALDAVWRAPVDRTRFQRDQVDREAFRGEVPTLEDFISGLGLEITTADFEIGDLPRVVDLIARTNQFTTRKDRKSEAELSELLHSGGVKGRITRVRDRFGDYGLVGVALYAERPRAIHVTRLLLSCRALGRGVEHQMLMDLANVAEQHNRSTVELPFVRSGKNEPAYAFLHALEERGKRQTISPQEEWFSFPTKALHDLQYRPSTQPGESRQNWTAIPITPRSSSSAILRRQLNLGEIASRSWNDKALGDFLHGPKNERALSKTSYVAPRTAMESKLTRYVSDILSVHDVGVEDDFFDLGGDSLTGIRLLARVGEEFNVGLLLYSLFESPTVAALASRIEKEIALPQEEIELIPPSGVADSIPLSFIQRRLWAIDQLHPGNSAYVNDVEFGLSGPLDGPALVAALESIFERHEILRTRFPMIGDQPAQVIEPRTNKAITWINLAHLPEAEAKREARKIVDEAKGKPFELSLAPPVRITAVQATAASCICLLSIHHILFDAWSIEILMRDLTHFYSIHSHKSTAPLAPLRIQYKDYSVWQRQLLHGDRFRSQLDYWIRELEDVPTLELPTQRPRPAAPSYRGQRRHFEISAENTTRLRKFCRETDVTLFMMFLAAWQIILSRYTGQELFAVGTPVAGRRQTDLENLIGVFVQTLALTADLKNNPTVDELLNRCRDTVLRARLNQDAPFDLLVSRLHPQRSLSNTPIFQVMISFTDRTKRHLDLPGIDTQLTWCRSDSALFDLSLFLADNGDFIDLTFEYDQDLFDAGFVDRLGARYLVTLTNLATALDRHISEIEIFDTDDLRMLSTVNAERATACTTSIIELFEAQVERTPRGMALISKEQELTYEDLNHRANQVAHHLRHWGVGTGGVVAVCLDRTANLVITLLGILKSGASYVPLDPCYPLERLKFILNDAATDLVITDEESFTRRALFPVPVLSIRDPGNEEALAHESTANLTRPSPETLAYIIYTSGSTGMPKGVEIEHRNVASFLTWCSNYFGSEAFQGTLASTSICFDLSIFEMFAPLTNGGAVVLIRSALDLVDAASIWPISLLNTVPSVATQLAKAGKIPLSVRVAALAGEPLSSTLVKALYSAHKNLQEVHNLYGPTETTTYSTAALITSSNDLPPTIGTPIANTQVFIADRHMQLVPCDIPGEIYIGGNGVARCYHRRPSLTAARFLPDLFSGRPGGRLYRTGDRALYRPDGSIEYLGRIDRQVKLRGFRIELGEVEAHLMSHPAVAEAGAILRDDPPRGKKLTAYVACSHEKEIDVADVSSYLKQRVPGYMIPDEIVIMDSLPRTTSGKINYKQLPAPPARHHDEEPASPLKGVAGMLATIWAEVLGLERVDIRDNFFEIGGDSILGIQIASRAHQAGLNIMPRDLFLYQTIADILPQVDRLPISNKSTTDDGNSPSPLTPIQKWFFSQGFTEQHHWNQSVLLDVRSDIPFEAVRLALAAATMRHPSLRSFFSWGEGVYPTQSVAFDELAGPEDIDLSDHPVEEHLTLLKEHCSRLQKSFDLTRPPLFRSALFTLGEKERYLFLTAHHLVIDVVSWHILHQDLNTACRQILAREEVTLAPEEITYSQWSSELRRYSTTDVVRNQLQYWARTQEHDRDLPTDWDKGSNDMASEAQVALSLLPEETEQLITHGRLFRATVEEVLVASLVDALRNWTGYDHITIDLEGHGREPILSDCNPSRTIGWFTTLYPVTFKVASATELIDTLRLTKQQLRQIPTRGLAYNLLRFPYEEASPLPAAGPASIVFNYLGYIDRSKANHEPFSPASFTLGDSRSPGSNRPHLLEVGARISGGSLKVTLGYSQNLHKADTIASVGNYLLASLRALLGPAQESESRAWIASDFPNAGIHDADVVNILTSFRGSGGENVVDIYPLSPMQEGILFQSELNRDSDLYVMQVSCRLVGVIDYEAFSQAWNQAACQYDVLRASFHPDERGRLFSVIERNRFIQIDFLDWSVEATTNEESKLEPLRESLRHREFALKRAPLFNLTLIHVGGNQYEFIWTYHHAILDGWSASLVLERVLRSYESIVTNKISQGQKVRPFSDYVTWMRKQDDSIAEEFWKRRLDRVSFGKRLAIDRGLPSASNKIRRFDILHLPISSRKTTSLIRFARTHHLTPHSVLQGAWTLLLSHYGHEEDVIFGTITSGRPPELHGVDEMAGLFINALPVYIKIDKTLPIVTWLGHIQAEQARQRQFEYISLHQLQRQMKQAADDQLFDIIFSVNNYPQVGRRINDTGLTVEDIHVTDWNNYALSGSVSLQEELILTLKYDRAHYERGDMGTFSSFFQLVLEEMIREGATVKSSLTRLQEASMVESSSRDLLYIQTATSILRKVQPR